MNKRLLLWFGATLALTLLAAASAPAFPQEQAEPAQEPEPAAAENAQDEAIESILRRQAELVRGAAYAYDPQSRRDPFRSLYEAVHGVPAGPRPHGVAGMLIAELDLTGIVEDAQGGNVALVLGTDNKGYFLKVGDVVYDGTVIAVDPRLGAVTFRQQVDDPRLIKPYKDIVKRLIPLEDEESFDE